MKWKLIVALVAALIVMGWFGVALAEKVEVKKAQNAQVVLEGEERAKKAAVITPPELVQPERVPGEAALSLTGTLEPEATVQVAFKIPGRVTDIHYRRGDVVELGKPMATLETRDVGVQDAQAKAALKVAKAQKDAAADTVRRTKQLTDAGVGTQQQLALVQGQASVSSAAIAQALAAAEAVDAMRAETTIAAPLGGTVVEAPTSTGFLTQPGAPIFKIENLSTLRFVGHLAERDAVRVVKGAPVTVMTEAGRTASGQVSLVLGSIDPVTHRVPVEALIDNADGSLFAGALVDAAVGVRPEPLLSLPMTALLTGEVPGVLVAAEDGKLERRAVDIAEMRDGRIFLRSGVDTDDRVVAAPGTDWRAGDVLPAAPAAETAAR